ncbi:hypothetical protein M9H77_36680 [Catharanthus roseus]|uniref:Uncharacterized protein n=1 Tax=Catharanthus roseus TaxID=4058 RepID=A0ACB9ZSW2_CATRO|nr:hypothetical protein M9H77_36680 [Catharanthus roseus]
MPFTNVMNHSSYIGDNSLLLECSEEEDTGKRFKCLVLNLIVFTFKVNNAEFSTKNSLVRSAVSSEEDAFKLYNDHAFRLGFSVCNGNQKFKTGWMKSDKGKGEKAYTKVDFRLGCKAMIEFRLNDEGGWTVNRHDALIHSQRQVTKNNDGYLQELKDSGVSIAIGLRVLKKQVGVVSKWRSNANMEDFRCKERYVEMIVTKSKLLKHANEVILDKYILNRWTKDIDLSLGSSSIGDVGKVSKKDIASYSAWRREIIRKFSNLISAGELNINAQEYVEAGFRMMKDKIASEVGPYYVDNSNNEVGSPILKI